MFNFSPITTGVSTYLEVGSSLNDGKKLLNKTSNISLIDICSLYKKNVLRKTEKNMSWLFRQPNDVMCSASEKSNLYNSTWLLVPNCNCGTIWKNEHCWILANIRVSVGTANGCPVGIITAYHPYLSQALAGFAKGFSGQPLKNIQRLYYRRKCNFV